MSQAKTTITGSDVETFIESAEPIMRRDEARALDALFRRVTGETPKMWGGAIIGYGEYRTTYESGRAVHWMRSGFSPKKARHSLYLQGGYCDDLAAAGRAEMLARLGRHSTGKSCLYLTSLAGIDMAVHEDILADDWEAMPRLLR